MDARKRDAKVAATFARVHVGGICTFERSTWVFGSCTTRPLLTSTACGVTTSKLRPSSAEAMTLALIDVDTPHPIQNLPCVCQMFTTSVMSTNHVKRGSRLCTTLTSEAVSLISWGSPYHKRKNSALRTWGFPQLSAVGCV